MTYFKPHQKPAKRTKENRKRVDWDGFEVPKSAPVRLKGYELEKFRKSIFKRDGYKCKRCGSKKNLTMHHKPKRSQGGSDIPEHCHTVCMECHDLIERKLITEDFLTADM